MAWGSKIRCRFLVGFPLIRYDKKHFMFVSLVEVPCTWELPYPAHQCMYQHRYACIEGYSYNPKP